MRCAGLTSVRFVPAQPFAATSFYRQVPYFPLVLGEAGNLSVALQGVRSANNPNGDNGIAAGQPASRMRLVSQLWSDLVGLIEFGARLRFIPFLLKGQSQVVVRFCVLWLQVHRRNELLLRLRKLPAL